MTPRQAIAADQLEAAREEREEVRALVRDAFGRPGETFIGLLWRAEDRVWAWSQELFGERRIDG